MYQRHIPVLVYNLENIVERPPFVEFVSLRSQWENRKYSRHIQTSKVRDWPPKTTEMNLVYGGKEFHILPSRDGASRVCEKNENL